MIRFLNSINIENIDDFDMDFEMIARDRFKPDQWNMVIVKKTPWNYCKPKLFNNSSNVTYKSVG